MHYFTAFQVTDSTGKKTIIETLGGAYASVCQSDEPHAFEIAFLPPMEDGEHSLILSFDHLENFVADLYRTGRERFYLCRYHLNFSADGQVERSKEHTSVLTFQDLQDFFIAAYPTMRMPIQYVLNLATKKWKYYGLFTSGESFEVF